MNMLVARLRLAAGNEAAGGIDAQWHCLLSTRGMLSIQDGIYR